MRAVLLFLAAGGGGWLAVHQTMAWLAQPGGTAQAPMLFPLVIIPAGLIGALVSLLLVGLVLPPAR